jgi:methylated-DNA-[protein]-cysteine S-methyltransferase
MPRAPRDDATDEAGTVFERLMNTISTRTVTFDTTLGRCAVRWTDVGISGVLLPHRFGRPGPTIGEVPDVPAWLRDAVVGMTATMAGEAADLRTAPLDEREIDPWRRSVYAATRDIPPGQTRSYGELARTIGREDPQAARDVGAALARNPFPIVVPCHRVVAADGSLHGFSAPGGLATKRRMLELEGAPGYGQQLLFG